MNALKAFPFWLLVVGGIVVGFSNAGQSPSASDASFKNDVMPIFKKYCLPCHSEDNYNPSELSLDSYELLMEGGKHGVPVIPGSPDKSILVEKLTGSSSFGDPMPLAKKQSDGSMQQRHLTDEELALLKAWITQGAKDN
jgi:hypothetical protein